MKTYQVAGMTCMSCVAKVKEALEGIEGIKSAEIDKEKGTANIELDKIIPIAILQNSLAEKYTITSIDNSQNIENNDIKIPWHVTYKPILMIFQYILFITLAVQ